MRLRQSLLAATILMSPIAAVSAQTYYPSMLDKTTPETMVLDKLTASQLIGKTVRDPSGKDVGEVSDILLQHDAQFGRVIVDVGGFLGVGERKVALDPKALAADERGEVRVNMSKAQLEALPEFKRSDRGWHMVESTSAAPVFAKAPVTAKPTDTNATSDWRSYESADRTAKLKITSLVGASELIGKTIYDINDKNVGEIADLLVEPDNTVKRVIIDVGGFLGIGEKPVAIMIDQLRIDTDRYVYVDATKETLESMPTYVRRDDRWTVRG